MAGDRDEASKTSKRADVLSAATRGDASPFPFVPVAKSMAISESTYHSRKRALLRRLKKVSKNGSQSFYLSSAWAQRAFGIEYSKMLREIADTHGLTITKQEELGFYDGTDVIKRGTCREYSFPAAIPPIPSTTPLPNPDSLDADAREFLEVYTRSNLADLGIDFAHKSGQDGDGRVYTSVTQHSKKYNAPLMLDGQATVEVDIPNAFAAFLISACPVAEDDLRAVANAGKLYEMLMAATGVDNRSLVKKAFNILLNKKGRLQFRTVDEDGWAVPQTLEQFQMHRVTKYVALAFPKFYKWARKQANAGTSYYMASQIEKEIMQACANKLRAHIPAHSFTRKHDAIFVAAQYEGVVKEVMKRVLSKELRQPSTPDPSLFVPSQQGEQIRHHLAKEWVPIQANFRSEAIHSAWKSVRQEGRWKRNAIAVLNRIRMAWSPMPVVR